MTFSVATLTAIAGGIEHCDSPIDTTMDYQSLTTGSPSGAKILDPCVRASAREVRSPGLIGVPGGGFIGDSQTRRERLQSRPLRRGRVVTPRICGHLTAGPAAMHLSMCLLWQCGLLSGGCQRLIPLVRA